MAGSFKKLKNKIKKMGPSPGERGGFMLELSREYIQTKVADSALIYKRGQALFEHGAFMMTSADLG